MRLNTTYFWGWRNIGDSTDQGTIEEHTVQTGFNALAKWLAAVSVATRIQLVIARTADEAAMGLSKSKRESAVAEAELDPEILQLFEDFGFSKDSAE
jgi:hypothetical protein